MATNKILDYVKLCIGIDPDDEESFDIPLIVEINSALFTLKQLGIGPSSGFRLTDGDETWEDFLGSDEASFEAAKTYIWMRVKIAFDPPANGTILQALKDTISEYEWRMKVENEF